MEMIHKDIEVKSKKDVFYIYPLGDVHIGVFNCAESHFKRLVQYIARKKNAYWFGGGDFCDCIAISDPRFTFRSLADWIFTGTVKDIKEALTDISKQERDRFCEIVAPIKDKCIALIEGNHEAVYMKRLHNGHQYILCEQLGVRNMTDCGFIRLNFKIPNSAGRVVKIWAMHGCGAGRSVGAEPNHLMRMGQIADADIVLRGHCFSEDTELLTTNGWVKYSNITVGDEIYNYNIVENRIQKDAVQDKFVFDDYKSLIRIKNLHTDLLVTPKHDIVYRYISQRPNKHYKHLWLKKPATFFQNKVLSVELPCASVIHQNNCSIEDCWIRLIGLLISEGHFRKNCRPVKNKHRNPHAGIQIYQREGNEAYIRDVLVECNLDFSEYNKKDAGKISVIRGHPYETHNNTIVFYIKEKSAKQVRQIISSKQIPKCVFRFSEQQFDIFVEAMIYGDGSIKGNNAYAYYSNDTQLLDTLQCLCAIFGYRTKLNLKKFCLNLTKRLTTTITRKAITEKQYTGKVWCVNTKNGTVIVRRNGCVTITGNSHTFRIEPSEPHLFIPDKGHLPDEAYQREVYKANWGCWLKSYAKGPPTYDSQAAYPPRPLKALEIKIKPFHSTSVKVCGKSVIQTKPLIQLTECPYEFEE